MSTATASLFQPLSLGALDLPNRMVMAPMTRSRAGQPGDVPTALMAEYYAQRASAGLILTEATSVSERARAYAAIPGVHTPEQVAGWRGVTEAVHAAGGRIALQLFHGGRVSHVDLQPDGAAPVAPSAVRAETMTYTPTSDGMVPVSEPRALETAELPEVVREFRAAAANARAAGFDGVQLHAANGYLIDQFLRDGSNRREDDYGGSIENRLRLPLEVVEALCDELGPERVSVRVSPLGDFNSMSDSDPEALFVAFARELSKRSVGLFEVVEAMDPGQRDERALDLSRRLRSAFDGPFAINGGYGREDAAAALEEGRADLVSFGKPFLANPDLPARFQRGAELNEADTSTFYGGEATGYTDYPTL